MIFVSDDVVRVITLQLKERDGLTGAVQRHARRVGCVKIIARIQTRNAGTGRRRHTRRFILFQQSFLQNCWTRNQKIIQPADVQNWEIQIHRRLRVRRKKIARLARMPVSVQRDVKCALGIRDARLHVQHHAIGRRAGDDESVLFRKFSDGGVIGFRRAEARGELRRLDKFMEV